MDIAGIAVPANILLGAGVNRGESVSLAFAGPGLEPHSYPASRIQKGLLIACADRGLAEEGTGFGVPVLKYGHETVFPGSASVTHRTDGDVSVVKMDYELNLVKRLSVRGKRLNSLAAYRVKELLAGLHRRYPFVRRAGTWGSNRLRRVFSVETRFETIESKGTVSVTYIILPAENLVRVVAYLGEVEKYGCTGISILNEMGASFFDRYHDSSGLALMGKAIGSWDETKAEAASFTDAGDGITFTLRRVEGARMFRGRELVPGKLAWSGLDYVVPPGTTTFAYDISIGGAR